MTNHGRLVPNFIEARGVKALRFLMMKTNLKDKAQNQYFDISSYTNKRGQLTWIAWYYSDFTLSDADAE